MPFLPSTMEHFIVHPARGGLDTVQSPTHLPPDALQIATNVEYWNDGSRRKRGGTTRLNSTGLTESGTAITFTALADFWRHGASLTPTQRTVAAAGTQLWNMASGDGTWNSIKTSWGSNTAITDITIAQGLAIFSNNNNQAPQKWDQTTEADLGGTPPNFSFSIYHLRRLWYAGSPLNPSTVNATAAGNVETHSGADYLTYVIDEDDGDRVIGLSEPWRRRIFVFKGPNKGSIHELAGLTASTITRDKLVDGAPCISHNSIITTPNDVYWASNYGFHSLRTTQKYGDTEELFLSAPIHETFQTINFTRTNQIQGFWHPFRNIVGWIAPLSGQTQNTIVFVYNYALNLWSTWTFGGFNPSCVAVMRDPATSQGQPRLYIGDYSGRVHGGDQNTKSDDDGTVAYSYQIRTPIHTKLSQTATEMTEKQFYGATTFFRPKGNYNATLDIAVDGRSAGSFNVLMQGVGATLGAFVLDTDRLGGLDFTYVETPFLERGRSVELTYTVGGAGQDAELYGHAIRYQQGELNPMETS